MLMKRIRKLTPRILKRIIREEKQKLLAIKNKKNSSKKLNENIKIAKKLKLEQKKALRHLRNVLKARRLIKNKINRAI
jgi:hypothetical protein